MNRWGLLPLAALLLGTYLIADHLEDTFYIPLDHPAIHYTQGVDDPVARLDRKIDSGQIKLDYAANGWGYLPALLKALDINPDSQVLVFSKTSIQGESLHLAQNSARDLF